MKAGFVSLIGGANAGKSTLLNRIHGPRSPSSDKPQTTRTRILGVKNYPTRRSFLDTPGIHRPLHRMNGAWSRRRRTICEVDVLGSGRRRDRAAGQGRPLRDRPGEACEGAGLLI